MTFGLTRGLPTPHPGPRPRPAGRRPAGRGRVGGRRRATLTVTAPTDTALYSGCYEYPYTYAVTPPTADWDLAVTLTDPRGALEASDHVSAPEPVAGTGSFLLCGGTDDYGTYTISAQLTSYDAGYKATVERP